VIFWIFAVKNPPVQAVIQPLRPHGVHRLDPVALPPHRLTNSLTHNSLTCPQRAKLKALEGRNENSPGRPAHGHMSGRQPWVNEPNKYPPLFFGLAFRAGGPESQPEKQGIG